MAPAVSPLEFGRDVARQSLHDDIVGMSAELAYRFFLALFPFFIFLAALGGFVATQFEVENPAEQAVRLIGDALPEEGAAFVEEQLRNIIDNQSRGQLFGGALLAIIFATGGTNAVIKALNRAYGVKEKRAFWRRYLVGLVLTVSAGAGSVLAFMLFVPFRILAPALADALGVETLRGPMVNVLAVAASIVIVFGAVTLLFRLGPNIRLPIRAVVPGAALFGVGWLVATFLFGIYVSEFGDYASTYGILANVVIVMIWFYVLAFVLLASAEVNVALHERRDPRDMAARRQEAEDGDESTLDSVRQATRRLADPDEDEQGSGAGPT
ncbi:YihY/virulence factor BrkB family protein [soil metagenome]